MLTIRVLPRTKWIHHLVTIAVLLSMFCFYFLSLAPHTLTPLVGLSQVAPIDQTGTGFSELSEQEWGLIQAALRQDAYSFAVQPGKLNYTAENKAQGFRVNVQTAQPVVESIGDQDWDWALKLEKIGKAGQWQFVGSANNAKVLAERYEVLHNIGGVNITEWYLNKEEGLEHGLTIDSPISSDLETATDPISIDFVYTGSLIPREADDGDGIVFGDGGSSNHIRYNKLYVFDADGNQVPAKLDLLGDNLMRISIFDYGYRYPITVDPLLTNEIKKVAPGDGEQYDNYGFSVAIDGDTAVVGMPVQDPNTDPPRPGGDTTNEAVYILYRNVGGQDGWSLQKKITPSSGGPDQNFGNSVAISGDFLIVGADYFTTDTINKQRMGGAYIYSRNLGGADNWGEVKRLTASDAGGGDRFGFTVDIEGEFIAVGAPFDDTSGAILNIGSAYLFSRNVGGADNWGEVKKLVGDDSTNDDRIGYSVSISGDHVILGSPYKITGGHNWAGAAYIFTRNIGGADNWGQEQKLVASDASTNAIFGWTVAMSGDLAVIGAPRSGGQNGSAYVFYRDQDGGQPWREIKKLVPRIPETGFGWSVDLDGEVIVIGSGQEIYQGSTTTGSAIIFERNFEGADSWGQVARLASSDLAAGDIFGFDVSIMDNFLIVGAPFDDNGASLNVGSAYIYRRTGTTWSQEKVLLASDGSAGDKYGYDIAQGEDFIVVGAPNDDGTAGNNQGAVYVLNRNMSGADGWGEVKKIVSLTASAEAQFGASVAVAVDHLVVGAPGESGGRGAAYVFYRHEAGIDDWGQKAKLASADGNAGDAFGASVSLQTGIALIGAPGVGLGQGAGYVFARNQGGADVWGQVDKLTAVGGVAGDNLGQSVAFWYGMGVLGAPGVNSGAGAAYIFYRNLGGADTWGQADVLTAGDGNASDGFGKAVDISHNLAVIGAPDDDVSGRVDQGSVYVFGRNVGGADTWGQMKQLFGSATAGERFGSATVLTGEKIVVGAPKADQSGSTDIGAAYVFFRNQGGTDNWGQNSRIVPVGAAAGDEFGTSVTILGTSLVGGAPLYGSGDRGNAYVFRLTQKFPDLTISKTAAPDLVGPGDLITYTIAFNNQGDEAATNVMINDPIPAALTNLSWSSTGIPITLVPSSRYQWQVGTLAPEAGGVITVTGTIGGGATSGVLINTAQISGSEQEIYIDNNTSTAAVTVDVTPPNVPLPTSPVNGATISSSSVVLAWQANNAAGTFAGFLLRFEGQVLDLGIAQTYRINNLADGSYDWQVAAYDALGNISAYSPLRTFTVTNQGINQKPIANAGINRYVTPNSEVTLSGAASFDPDGNLPMTFAWTQTSGDPVSMTQNGANVTFTAPAVLPGQEKTLIFKLEVTDFLGAKSDPDFVTVIVSDSIRIFLPTLRKNNP